MNNKMPKLIFGDLVVDKPIIQGGMGVGISLSNLAAAVANAGGIGVISSIGINVFDGGFKKNPREINKISLREEIRKAKQKSNGVIGVNIMVAVSDFIDHVNISIEEGADIIFTGAGLQLRVPEILLNDTEGKYKTKVIPIVSSARAAKLIFRTWDRKFKRIPDGVVVEGPLAGGHIGFKMEEINDPNFQLEKLIPEVISTIKFFEDKYKKKIPIIAGGGVYTGADIKKFIKLGASGVQMGTRFVATFECDASQKFKDAYIKCKKEDIVIIKSPVGLPGRAINNQYLKDVSSGKKVPISCPWKCLIPCDYKYVPYCIAFALTNSKHGIFDKGFAFAGANAYRVNKIIPVKELITTLEKEYLEA